MREYLTLKELRELHIDKITRLQNIRLKAAARHLMPHTKAYAKLFKEYGADFYKIKSTEDWWKQGLPLLKKSFYLKGPKDFIVNIPKEKIVRKHAAYLLELQEADESISLVGDTVLHPQKVKEKLKEYYALQMPVFSSGTESGIPTPVFFTAKQKENLDGILKVIGELLLENENGVGMNLFPYGPHLAWHAGHRALDTNGIFNLGTAAGGAMTTEQLVKLANEFKPNIFLGMISYFKNRFLPIAAKNKIKLPEKITFVHGATALHEGERETTARLARKLGVKNCTVLNLFGASEMKEGLLAECAQGTGLHTLAPLSNIIRTVSFESARKDIIEEWDFTEKNGYTTVWNIDGAGTLLEGYVLGDLVQKTVQKPCTRCRVQTERYFGISRIKEAEQQLNVFGFVEEKVKGARLNLTALRERLLKNTAVQEAQLIISKDKKKMEVRYVPHDTSKALKHIQKVFKEEHFKPKIKKVSLDGLETGKYKFEGVILRG